MRDGKNICFGKGDKMIYHFMGFRMIGSRRVNYLNLMSSTCEDNKGVVVTIWGEGD